MQKYFSGALPVKRVNGDQIYVSRNPEVFCMVIDYLQSKDHMTQEEFVKSIEGTYIKNQFKNELKYWGLIHKNADQ